MSDFFRLRRWVAPYRGRLFSAIVCSIVSVVCLTAGVVLIKPIIEQMAPARAGARSPHPPAPWLPGHGPFGWV